LADGKWPMADGRWQSQINIVTAAAPVKNKN